MRNVMDARVADVGDTVYVGGFAETVLRIRRYGPEQHYRSPIRNDLSAVEVVTTGGSRWFGSEYYSAGTDETVWRRRIPNSDGRPAPRIRRTF